MFDTDIARAENSIEFCKSQIALAGSVQKLESNRDFKKLILEGYLKEEALRLVGLLSAATHPEMRDAIHRDLHAIGAFEGYLRKIVAAGQMAAVDLPDHEETLSMLRAELDEE